MEIIKNTRCNKVLYHRIASTHQSIDSFLKHLVELEGLMEGVDIDWDTMSYTEEVLDIKCGDNLEVTLTVQTK